MILPIASSNILVLSMVFTLNCQQTCNNGEDDEAEDVCGIAPSPFHLPSLAERRNLTLRSSMLQCNIDAMNNPTKNKGSMAVCSLQNFCCPNVNVVVYFTVNHSL